MAEIFIFFQRLLPAFLLGRFIHWLSRQQTPWVKNMLIRGFSRLYAVDMTEAAERDGGNYPSFNAFFTRRLRPDARPQDPNPKLIVCPADGRVQATGRIDDDKLMQAKGINYSLFELLGDSKSTTEYLGGSFLTVYLAPHDYHRVHAPLAGTLRAMRYSPGKRWAVNQITAQALPGLFALNERISCHFTAPWGKFALVMVGALNVASISTVWAGEVLPLRPRRSRSWLYRGMAAATLQRGDEIGHFNLGSTVILLLPPEKTRLDETLKPGDKLRVGTSIGKLLS